MQVEEARIVAHICADGCLSKWIEKNSLQIVHGRRYYRDRPRYEIIYTNTCSALLDQFYEDISKVYGVKPRRIHCDIRTRSKRVFERIMALGGNSTYKWAVSKEIFESNKKCKVAWLRAFFDDEGTVERNTGRVRVKSMNAPGLKQVGRLLSEFKINYTISGPNCDKSWYLTINAENAKRYATIINFDHTEKRRLLKAVLKTD